MNNFPEPPKFGASKKEIIAYRDMLERTEAAKIAAARQKNICLIVRLFKTVK